MDGIHMRKNLLYSVYVLLFLVLIIAPAVYASPLIVGEVTFNWETFFVIIGAVAIITALCTYGGIKYVTPENVLDTSVRRNLYEYIDEYPGSHLREIARELSLKPSNAAWHLRKLEQTNLVRSRNIGGKKVYYLVEGGIETRKEAVAESILRNDNAQRIMQYLVNNPGKHLLEIAHALQLNHHTVKWHIQKMYMAELIEGDTTNSAYPVYYPTETGSAAVRLVAQKKGKKKSVVNKAS